MKDTDLLILGGAALIAASLIKTPSGKTVIESVAGQTGAALGASVPTALAAGAGSFASTSYNAGFDLGAAVGRALSPNLQLQAQYSGIVLPSARPTEAQFNQAYFEQTSPNANNPLLGIPSAIWHNFLTGDSVLPFTGWLR